MKFKITLFFCLVAAVICGYFLGSVLNDPAFKEYRKKFDAPHHDPGLVEAMYDCGGYFSAPSDSDSISIDSLDIDGIDEYLEYDDQGYPINNPSESDDSEDLNQEPSETNNAEATKED